MLFHREVFIPQQLLDLALNFEKSITDIQYSFHFLNQHVDESDYKHYINQEKLTNILKTLSVNQITPFEIEADVVNNKLVCTKIVVRLQYDDMRDVSVAMVKKQDKNQEVTFVKTAWLNQRSDKHFTLNTNLYISQSDWKRMTSK